MLVQGLFTGSRMWTWNRVHVFSFLPTEGIKEHEKRVATWITKELVKAKSGAWGCVQTRKFWSTEEVDMRPGHHWPCEFGDPGDDTSCEKEFNLPIHCHIGRGWITKGREGDTFVTMEDVFS